MKINHLFFVLVLLAIQGNLAAQIGILDNSFNSNGIVENKVNGTDTGVRSMVLQNDKKIIVGGAVYLGSRKKIIYPLIFKKY